jgi:hypothetical protein
MLNPSQPGRSGSSGQPQGVNYFEPYKEPGADRRVPEPPKAEPEPARTPPPAPEPVPSGRGRGPLPWILALGGGAVIAIVAVLVVVLTSGEDPGDSPQGTADAFANAVNSRDLNGINAMMCDVRDRIDVDDIVNNGGAVANVRVKSVSAPNNGKAIAILTATLGNTDEDEPFPLRQRDNGQWCVGRAGDVTN